MFAFFNSENRRSSLEEPKISNELFANSLAKGKPNHPQPITAIFIEG
jgi:hypothetical protein